MNPYGETFALFYDRHFNDYAEKTAPHLLRFFAGQPSSLIHLPVLDLGCGTGRLALRFLEAGYAFIGIDVSPAMLVLAENHCWNYVVSRKARFLQEDMSRFQIGGLFGMVVSTYNSMNHLESEGKIRGCFQSVRGCLAPGAPFVFDLHTLSGLKEWASAESIQWGEEKLDCRGEFDAKRGKAIMRLKGMMDGQSFEQSIVNHAFSLLQIADWLNAEGFKKYGFYRIDDLGNPLREPEKEKRIVIIVR